MASLAIGLSGTEARAGYPKNYSPTVRAIDRQIAATVNGINRFRNEIARYNATIARLRRYAYRVPIQYVNAIYNLNNRIARSQSWLNVLRQRRTLALQGRLRGSYARPWTTTGDGR